MAFTDAIVSYTNLVQPFGTQANLITQTQQVAAKVITDPAKLNSTMSDFTDGLNAWQKAEIQPRVFHTPCHPMGSLVQSHILAQANLANKIESFFEKIADAVLESFEVRFASDDWLGWAASFFTWIGDLAPATQPPPSPVAAAIGNNFNIGVLGDFGTGRYGAPMCQKSIDSSGDAYDLMLHLGDVYYSATDDEVAQRFVKFWPTIGTMTRVMNGNHEMYTGGHSYFGTMLPRYQQTASYFALQNDNWLLAVLDTAYHQAFGGQEGVLDDAQMQWLQSIVNLAGTRAVVLFSHHQPFTQLDDNNGGNLLSQFEKYGLANRIFAWYWGHEHRCLMYDPHPQFGFHGRCVGHAAFPQARPNLGNAPVSGNFGSQWRQLLAKSGSDSSGATVPIPGAWVYDNNNLYMPIDFAAQFSPNGFMRLEFSGNQIAEYVRTPLNANIWEDTLTFAPQTSTSAD
jgi:hypothetical protein